MTKYFGYRSIIATSTGELAQLRSIDGPGMSFGDVDTTTMDSSTNYRTFVPSLGDAGEDLPGCRRVRVPQALGEGAGPGRRPPGLDQRLLDAVVEPLQRRAHLVGGEDLARQQQGLGEVDLGAEAVLGPDQRAVEEEGRAPLDDDACRPGRRAAGIPSPGRCRHVASVAHPVPGTPAPSRPA